MTAGAWCLCSSPGQVHAVDMCYTYHGDEDQEHRHHQDTHLGSPHRWQLSRRLLVRGEVIERHTHLRSLGVRVLFGGIRGWGILFSNLEISMSSVRFSVSWAAFSRKLWSNFYPCSMYLCLHFLPIIRIQGFLLWYSSLVYIFKLQTNHKQHVLLDFSRSCVAFLSWNWLSLLGQEWNLHCLNISHQKTLHLSTQLRLLIQRVCFSLFISRTADKHCLVGFNFIAINSIENQWENKTAYWDIFLC